MDSRGFERDERDPRPFPGPNASKTYAPYRFTAEELRVLRECNKESFFKRCIPFSALLSGGLYYGVKAGFLKGNAKYGAAPKVIVGVVVGYFLGKFSYQGKCAEKLMMLPNSVLGEMLRQRKKEGFQESLDSGFGPGMSLSPFSNINPSDTYSDVPSGNDFDTYGNRPELEELDDSHRPTVDNPIYEEEMPPIQKKLTTHDELRRRNREEYHQKRIGNYKSNEPVLPAPKYSQDSESPNAQTNKYGDTWG